MVWDSLIIDIVYPEGYIDTYMEFEIRQTAVFKKWFQRLKDRQAKIRILARLSRVENGNFGDFKKIKTTQNLYELRFDFGPGYRIYYTIQNGIIVLLLAGGDKSSQKEDVNKAKSLME